MNTSIPSLVPEMASTLAVRFEWLFWYMTIVCSVVGFAVYGVLAYFCIRYRRSVTTGSTPRILGSHRMEIAWTIVPLMIFLTFFAWGAVIYTYAVRPPSDAMEVYVIGKQWMWKAQYPSGQRVIIGGNPNNMTEEERKSIGRLVLPVGRATKLVMTSEDVIHDFGIPAFRTKMDVLPGRYTYSWFQPTKIGEYHVFCDQYCGTWHSQMVGKVAVVSQGDFADWLSGHQPLQGSGNAVDGSLASEGRQLFLKLQCSSCHAGKERLAPPLEGIFGTQVTLKGGGKEIIDESYLIESILRPKLKVVQNYAPQMPSYDGQVSPEDLTKLVAYIRSMKQTGDAPARTENFPIPVGAPTEASKGGR